MSRDNAETGREVRYPQGQNEHLWCIAKIRGLTATERAVAYTLHVYCYVNGGSREMTGQYLADRVETGRKAAVDAANKLVRLGLFDRLDNGKGGRSGKGKAVYRPMVPGWWNRGDPGNAVRVEKPRQVTSAHPSEASTGPRSTPVASRKPDAVPPDHEQFNPFCECSKCGG